MNRCVFHIILLIFSSTIYISTPLAVAEQSAAYPTISNQKKKKKGWYLLHAT